MHNVDFVITALRGGDLDDDVMNAAIHHLRNVSRFSAALREVCKYGEQRNVHPADKASAMYQIAQIALMAGDE